MRDPEAATVDDVPSTPEEETALASFRAALKEENVVGAHILIDFGEDFLIAKAFNINLSQGDVEHISNAARQGFIGGSANQFHGLIHLRAMCYIYERP